MVRLGRSSVRAAMIYQHATRDRDRAIAKALGTFVRQVQNATENQRTTRNGARPGREPDTLMARVWHAGAGFEASEPQTNTENSG